MMNELFDITRQLSLIDEKKVSRVVLAKRVGQVMASGQAGDDLNMLESFARNLCRDDVEAVRGALSFELRRCERLAEDIAEIIAFDDPDVAAPFLQTSPALTDKLLVNVVQKADLLAQIAIARRLIINEAVGTAFAEYGLEKALIALTRNRGAIFNDAIRDRILVRFPNSLGVIGEMSSRDDLSPSAVKKIEKITNTRSGQKSEAAELPFAVLLANIRVMYRLGDLNPDRILSIIHKNGRDGLEALLMAVTDLPRHNITVILNEGNATKVDILFRDSKMNAALQKQIFLELQSKEPN